MAPLAPLLASLSLLHAVIATGTLSLNLEKKALHDGQPLTSNRIFKRQTSNAGTVETSVFDVLPWSGGGAYYTNVTVGTPPQVLTVILDTGSSDLYVDASSSQACEDTSSPDTCRGGSFNPSSSSSYKVAVKGGFNTSFGDGSTASGDFATEVVGIGDVVLSDVQLGVATNVNSTTGFAVSLMGIGYAANEASETPYPNMPEVLQQAGAINSRLYSVFLNQEGGNTGTILFGGIDTSKYTGQLHTLDILPTPIQDQNGNTVEVVIQFVVPITGISTSNNGKNNTLLANGDATGQDLRRSLPVLLDTGSAAWTVPTSTYNSIAGLWGSSLDRNGNLDCSHANDKISINIEFGGQVTINVPASNLVVPLYDPATNKPLTTTNGDALCTLMITPDEGAQQESQLGFTTLGDAVLRSMYVVFDLDNGQVSLAQTNTNAAVDAGSSGSGSNVKVVQAGKSGVANAVGSANGGVATASANANTILPEVTASHSLSFSTAPTAVGTATGADAVPEEGRVTNTATGTSSTSSSKSSKGAAPRDMPLASGGAFWIVFAWLAMGAMGFGLMM